ncbi:hypothetical protein ESCO_000235 [Escovopsis weberi]|uniref:DUF4185 domain-containing protein n=1 Tax=Escovopsis weberi TaxID=150374 RepID=A0A0M8N3Z4_ESCWE|nr:hypothetical protein ESCO_000235 [Escovopsis weberi]
MARREAKSATILGNVTDPSLTRDSCGSAKMGGRTLWTCRDTSLRIPGTDRYGFLFVNSAGWTDDSPDGSPAILEKGPQGAGSTGEDPILLMKGPRPTLPPFYPLAPGQCPPSGRCDDSVRCMGWPDSPPTVTEISEDGTVTAYTWTTNIRMASGDFTVLNPRGSSTLYKMTYSPSDDDNVLPAVILVDPEFWKDEEIGYGVYGTVVRDGYAYLYGLMDPKAVAVARVPVHGIEDRAQYEYYVGDAWTSSMPAIDDTGAAAIPNAGTAGQGSYYYDGKHNSYVWIGQQSFSIWADFFVTTAASPEGPWAEPYKLWSGMNGDGALPAYSLQAHPHYLGPADDGIYVTWTQFFKETTNPAVYLTPLAYISFV